MSVLIESAPEAPGDRRLLQIRPMASPGTGQLLVEPRSAADGRIFCTDAISGKTYQVRPDRSLGEVTDFTGVPMPVGTDAGEDTAGASIRTSSAPGTRPDEEVEIDANAVAAFVRDGQVFVRVKSGSAPSQIATGEDRIARASLSPDHKLVVLESPNTGLHIYDMEKGTSVAELGDGASAQWTRNGIIYRWHQLDEMGKPVLGDLYFADAGSNWLVSNLTQSPHTVEQDPVITPDGNSVLYSADGGIYLGQLY